MEVRDFEHGLLEKTFNLSTSVRTNIKAHDILMRENAEYRERFNDFAAGAKKILGGIEVGPDEYRDMTIKDIGKVLINCVIHAKARRATLDAAGKMHKIYEAYQTNSVAPAPK